MPESSLVKDIHSNECGAAPSRQYSQSLPLHRSSYLLGTFCTEQNVQECLSHISQEVSSLGLPPAWKDSAGSSQLNVVAVLNCMYDLIQLHRKGLRTLENMEVEQLKLSSNVDYLQFTSTRLKEQLEISKRENTGLLERERQLQMKVKSLQNCLKNEKEEVQKLQNVIASRASQYNHEMKRKEREFNKLKERLNQLLIDKKEKKQAIDVLNSIGRADGKRSLWKTEKTEAKHEGEMYKTILSDYDTRQRELMLENAELRKVLQHMKKDIVSILGSKKLTIKGEKPDDGCLQADSEEEDEVFNSSMESVELSCVHVREKLTNSIRLQWRRLKSHVERLDSQASVAQMGENENSDAVTRETDKEEMDRLKLEIQQCKNFIQAQQQLLQQQLSSPCDEETASLLSNCYMLQEKDRLRDEWKTLEEQRKIFERERRNFTEAAIRLSCERKTFEEDRAMWLKHQFLKFSPFEESKKSQMSKSKSAFLISESQVGSGSTTDMLIRRPSKTTSPTRCVPLATTDLHCTPSTSSTKPKRNTEHEEGLSVLCNGNSCNGHAPLQWNKSEDHSSHTQEINSSL